MVDEIRRPGSRERRWRVWQRRALRRGVERWQCAGPGRSHRHRYGLLGGLLRGLRRRWRRLGNKLLEVGEGAGLQEGVQDVVGDGRHGDVAAGIRRGGHRRF